MAINDLRWVSIAHHRLESFNTVLNGGRQQSIGPILIHLPLQIRKILGLFKAQYMKSVSTRQQTSCWKCGTVSPSGIIFGVATVDAYQLTVFYVAIAGLALQQTLRCAAKRCFEPKKVVSSTSGLATLPEKFPH